MKKKIQLTLLTILCVFNSALAQDIKAGWQLQPLVIDGNVGDWTTNPRYFNAAAKVQYEFRNDASNLYVILKANDMATQNQLMQAGFSVRFKVKSEPRLMASMAFPSAKEGMMPSMVNIPGDDSEKLMEKSAMKKGAMPKDSAYVEGFQFTRNSIAADNRDEKSICFSKNRSREQSIYEIRIPLRDFFGEGFAISEITAIPIQLQVTINGGSSKGGNRTSSRMGGGMQGGRRGGNEMPGGGMQGGGMSGGEDGGGEGMGERPSSHEYEMPNTSSASKKSFNIEFNLSSGK